MCPILLTVESSLHYRLMLNVMLPVDSRKEKRDLKREMDKGDKTAQKNKGNKLIE